METVPLLPISKLLWVGVGLDPVGRTVHCVFLGGETDVMEKRRVVMCEEERVIASL